MFWRIWLFILFIKLCLGAYIPLSSDEAYYWVWGQNLQLSYYDHPPFVAWLMSLGSILPNWAVRFPAILFAHFGLWFWYLMLKPYLDEARLKWSWILLSLVPLSGFGTIIVTPDLPLLFFWSASLYYFVKSLDQPEQTKNWVLLGSSIGLGFCSKYIIVLFPFFAFLYLIFSGQWRILRPKYVIYTIFFAVIASSPVWIWNAVNDWASFKFQLGGRYNPTTKSWSYFLSNYLGGQILTIFPTLIYLSFRATKDNFSRLNLFLAWGPVLFFALMALRGRVEANWPSPAHMSFAALAVLASSKLRAVKFTSYFWSAIIIVLLVMLGTNNIPATLEKVSEPQKFYSVASSVNKYENLFGSTYQMSSQIWFYNQKPFYKLYKMSRHDFFDEIQQQPNFDIFHLLKHDYEIELPQWVIENYHFEIIEKLTDGLEIVEMRKK